MKEKRVDKASNKSMVIQLLVAVCGFLIGLLHGIVFTWVAVFPICRSLFGGGEFLSGAITGLMLLFAGAAIGGFIGLAISVRISKYI